MRVQLISLTQPLLGGMVSQVINEESVASDRNFTAEELIVYIGRVSNPGNQSNLETAPKLINYLIKNHHWSPFEMANMTVEIVTSRAIAAQILRHRSFSFQEFSQRYAVVSKMEPVELRKQAVKNRQSSEEVFDPLVRTPEGEGFINASHAIQEHLDNGMLLYERLIAADTAKECARMVLPLTTQTTLYMNGSIRSWIHYLEQRTSVHTQLEHREIAMKIQNIFIKNFPSTSEALGLISWD